MRGPTLCRPMRPAAIVAILVVLVGLVALVAGCVEPDHPGDGDGATNGGDGNGGTNGNGDPSPIPSTLHFDGGRAYDLALAQLYDDPDNHSGPRYRLPGSTTTDEVANELRAALTDAMDPVGGAASIVDFTGADYYALDLWPVRQYLCPDDDPARDRVADITFHNVVGRTDPDEVGLIIGAHYDTKRHASHDPDPAKRDDPILGADDGAAGTAAVVELARVLALNPPGIPLTYVLFDGEDGFEADDCHPLAGSLHFAQSLSQTEVDNAHGMILLDMIGNASATFYREAYSQTYRTPSETVRSGWLGDLVWDTADALNVTAFDDTGTAPIADDHLPFLYEGIPSLDIIRYEDGFAEYWHTTHDDHTAIQPHGIERVGRVVEASVHVIAAHVTEANADAGTTPTA